MTTILPPKRFTSIGGRRLAHVELGSGDPIGLLHGNLAFAPRTGRMILLKFPSEAQIRDWYADPGSQALSGHRRAGTRLEFLTAVRGLPPRA